MKGNESAKNQQYDNIAFQLNRLEAQLKKTVIPE